MFEYSSTMKLYVMVVVLGLAATTLSVAIPKPDDHKDRVIDKELSDKDHFGDDEEHNPEYDHEAFLGRDEARTFEDLTPEQSKERLGKIYDKIDKDSNGQVTQEELREWIKYVQNKYIHEDTERQWKEHTIEDGKLSWDNYKSRTYGNIDESDNDKGDDYNYKDMVRRDRRRWDKADGDKDGLLSQEEFAFFLHPEEAEHMRDIVVEETLEDIDKDKDNLISLEEYIGDIYPGTDDDDEDDDERPDWVRNEKDQFATQRDKDGDGFLDHQEILDWILPEDFDHVHAEAEHLMREADKDQDGSLTKEEVVNKYDLFVGSQATDFGEALTRHDEF